MSVLGNVISKAQFFAFLAVLVLPSGLFAVQSPCGGASVDASPYVTLTWDAVVNARSYAAEVTTNAAFTSGIQTISGSSTSTDVTTLQNGTLYYWRMRSNSAQSWEPPIYTYGSICSFSTTVVTQVPQIAPTQNSPSNNGTASSTAQVGLSWTLLGGATAYEVQWSTSPTMSAGVLTSGVITSGLWQITCAPATTYYWRVRAQNSIGAGSWTTSPIWRFDTQSAVTPLTIKVLLQGPLVTTPSVTMIDGLRSGGHIPTSEPYSFGPTSYSLSNGLVTITPAQLAVTGNTAIIDWVVFQVRHGTTNAPLKAWVMILRKDGSVVLPGGTGINEALPMKNVKFSIHHRNHLGAMTGNAVDASGSALTIDFTATATVLHGTNPTYVTGTKRALWAGDCSGDGIVSYSGANNDRDKVLAAIGGVIPTNFIDGYRLEDVNMTGRTLYSGSANDRDLILSVIGGVIPTNTRAQQIP